MTAPHSKTCSCCGPKLYEHQRAIINKDPKRTGLFLGTGSGKTRTALLLARGRTLVICPKTQKEDGNWEREYMVLVSTGAIKLTELKVVSKESFRRDAPFMESYNTVIVDEAHTCLGVTPNIRQRKRQVIPKTSQLFEELQQYLERTRPERLYLCTATIMKSPMTVWGAGTLLGGVHNTIESFYAFRQKFYQKLPMPGRDVWVPKNENPLKDDLAQLVRDLGYVGRLEDFFDVPDQTFKTVHVELTPKQKDRIKNIRLEYPDPIVQTGKKHQIENGVLSGDEFNAPEHFDNQKIDRILEYALEFPRMVIFARYRAQIDQLQRMLTAGGYKVLTLTGDIEDRGALFKDANSSPACIVIAQCQISAGWELPDYPVMIFASRDYSFVNYDQALGRIQRANNIKKNLYISLVVKGGVDEAVDKSLANKCDFNERLYAETRS